MLETNDLGFLCPLEFGLDLPKAEIPEYRVQAFRNGLSTAGLVADKDWIEEKPLQVITKEAATDKMILLGIGIWKDNSLFPYKVL
jgi:tRNA pseudouridine55 synthase